MPISGGIRTVVKTAIEYDTDGRIASLGITYRAEYGTSFEVDGDLTKTLEAKGSVDYVKGWVREKLRKLENGQIKVVKCSTEERDWKQEEKVRKQMWEDVNVNSIPLGHNYEELSCYQELQTCSAYRPPSPTCKIS